MTQQPGLAPYDAVLVVGFGGPEEPADVRPFLERVAAGRNIPSARLDEVEQHYLRFGGRSPLNDQCRALSAALGSELARRGVPVPVAYGARNSQPFLVDTLRELHEGGARRVCVVLTSAYSSYSGCRQYREDIADALATLAAEGRSLSVDKVRTYANLPGFTETMYDDLLATVRHLGAQVGDSSAWSSRIAVAFVTHSIPTAMAETSGLGGEYVAQHAATAQAMTQRLEAELGVPLSAALVYCSRSGPPHIPWLEPDINDHLAERAGAGVTHVAVAPVGFISDHMEVVFDLDIEATATAQDLGMTMVRVPTVGTSPAFVAGLADLVLERAARAEGATVTPQTWPETEPLPDVCRPGCCRNLRGPRAAVAGRD